MQRFNGVALTLAAVIVGVAIAACGGSGAHPLIHEHGTGSARRHPAKPPTVDFYSSLPLTGGSAVEGRAIVDGIRLAMSQAGRRAGAFSVRYMHPMNDAAAGSAASAALAYANARRAATDPAAILYIGDFTSRDSAASIPILNLADIAQISPGSPYLGLTQSLAHVTATGEPSKYYPADRRTFLRLVPSDAVQAAAELMALQGQGVKCTRLAVTWEGQLGSRSLASLLGLEAKSYGITLVGSAKMMTTATALAAYALKLKSEGAACVALTGYAAAPAVRVADEVHAVLPNAWIIASDGLCRSAFTSAARHGVVAGVAPLVLCTQPVRTLASYPGATSFARAYRRRYGVSRPSPWALYGYVAARLGLQAVSQLSTRGDSRAAVVRWLFSGRNVATAIGTLSFEPDGDVTLNSYGLYKVGRGGQPAYVQTLTPTKFATGSF